MSAHNPKHTSDRITVGLKFPFHTKCFAPGVERTSDRRGLKSELEPAPDGLAFVLPPKCNLTAPRQRQRGYFMFLRRFRKFTERSNGNGVGRYSNFEICGKRRY